MNDLFIAPRQDFIELADAIRTKAKVKDGLAFPNGMIEAIEGIGSGGSSGAGSGSGGTAKALVPYLVMDFEVEIPATVISTIVTLPYKCPIPVFSIEEVTP